MRPWISIKSLETRVVTDFPAKNAEFFGVVRLVRKCNRKHEVGLSLFCDGIAASQSLAHGSFCRSALVYRSTSRPFLLQAMSAKTEGRRKISALATENSLTDSRPRL